MLVGRHYIFSYSYLLMLWPGVSISSSGVLVHLNIVVPLIEGAVYGGEGTVILTEAWLCFRQGPV